MHDFWFGGGQRARRGAPRGMESGEGRRSPSPGWGSGGIAPGKFLKFNSQICAFCIFAAFFAPAASDAEFNMQHVLILEV